MALTKEFTEAVDNGKKIRVRIMLKDIMLVDPSLKTFDEMLAYADKNMPDLYDQHDGEEFNNNSSAWDVDYMNQQMVSVVTNFSKERIDLLGKIVKKLYAQKIQSETKVTISKSNNTSFSAAPSSGFSRVQIAGAIVAVAGVGALIGGIVGSSAPVAIVGGVALTSGIVMVVFCGNKEA